MRPIDADELKEKFSKISFSGLAAYGFGLAELHSGVSKMLEMIDEAPTVDLVKSSFEPEEGESYWTYFTDWTPQAIFWDGDAYDLIHKAAGCIFRTEEEALSARPDRYKLLTGKEWKE